MTRQKFIELTAISTAGLFFNRFSGQTRPLPILTQQAIGGDEDAPADVLIIGTGYGGAVAALRLAEAGKNVKMLEMGMDWQSAGLKFSKMSNPKKQSTWLRTKSIAPFMNIFRLQPFTGVLDRMDFDHVKVYAGRGIGGGSLVNGSMSVVPKREYFEELFPELDAEVFYTTYFPKANKELGVHTIPEEFYQTSKFYRFSRVGEAEAHKAGYKTVRVPSIYDYDYMQKEENNEVPRSAFAQEVIYGNNAGKKDLTKTYLKRALATGKVTIVPLTKAITVSHKDGVYTVAAEKLNTAGEVILRKEFSAPKLVLAGGSLGTTELLLRSKHKNTLAGVNDQVGEFWGNNGNCMSGRNFVNTKFNPVEGRDKGKGTGVKQSTMPAAGIDNWSTSKGAFFTEIAPLPIGLESYAALYLSLNRVIKPGKITYDAAKDKIDIAWDESNYGHMVENTKTFLDNMIKHNGGTYAKLLFNRAIGPDICYHPLGGCVLGKATDLHGRLKGHQGLYVLDSSLIPASVGVNPYVTITALAEYCIENIIKKDFG